VGIDVNLINLSRKGAVKKAAHSFTGTQKVQGNYNTHTCSLFVVPSLLHHGGDVSVLIANTVGFFDADCFRHEESFGSPSESETGSCAYSECLDKGVLLHFMCIAYTFPVAGAWGWGQLTIEL
jgi:hypothetical protein